MPLSVSELRAALAALSLDSRGNKDTLKKRWLRANKSREPAGLSDKVGDDSKQAHRETDQQPEPIRRTRPPDQEYDSFLVFDVEATCERIEEPWGKLAFAYPNEIIEWPVILLQWQRTPPSHNTEESEAGEEGWELVQVDEYHSYVKPTWAKRISSFCTELTGIAQADLDSAPTFPKLCSNFHRDFIQRHGLFTPENRTVWVTDGPWDLRDFVSKTCYLSNTPRPDWLAGEIIDLRLLTCTFFALLKKEKKANARASRSPSPPSDKDTPRGAAVVEPSTSAGERAAESDPRASLPPPVPIADDAALPVALGSTVVPSSTTADNSVPTNATSATDYLPSHRLTAPAMLNLPSVLLALSLPAFEGRLHSGLSDARNASRILIDLARRGMVLEANRRVPEGGRGRERRWGWMEPGRGSQVNLATVQQRWEDHVKKEKVREAQIATLR